MDAVLANTSGGVHGPSGAGAGAECAAEAGDGDGGRNEVLDAGSTASSAPTPFQS